MTDLEFYSNRLRTFHAPTTEWFRILTLGVMRKINPVLGYDYKYIRMPNGKTIIYARMNENHRDGLWGRCYDG